MDTIASAAARLRRDETTARELVERSLTAIDEHNGRTNAFTCVHRTRARHEADRIDRERARGIDRGSLHGIPVSIKDLIDEAGATTTAGSHVLDDRIATADAAVVARLRDAGAIIIGRTNLHQFALGTTSEHSAFGPVRHPLDPARSPGGSSGGSAAAVATGMGLASLGTDTGGSVRIPAAVCGLVGLKPSEGEIPTDGVIPLSPRLDSVGPLARTAQDAGWMADVLRGRTPGDVPTWPVAGLRLRRLTGYFETPTAPEVRAGLDRALGILKAAGASVEASELIGTDAILPAYLTIVKSEAARWHAPYLDSHADGYLPAIRERILEGREFSAVQYLEALATARTLTGRVDSLLEGTDVLVTATLPIVAPPLGASELVVDPETGASLTTRVAMLKHTQLFNMTGHPAVSLPIATDGLPVGLQLVGRRDETARLLSVAAGIEAVLAS